MSTKWYHIFRIGLIVYPYWTILSKSEKQKQKQKKNPKYYTPLAWNIVKYPIKYQKIPREMNTNITVHYGGHLLNVGKGKMYYLM